MNYAAKLLPTVTFAKIERFGKDKHRDDKEQPTNAKKSIVQKDEQSASESEAAPSWDKVERRLTPDRREQQTSRGKWLDSRHKKDRRAPQSISLKI